jgi:HSP20 family protein
MKMKLVKYHRPLGLFDSWFDTLNRGLFPAFPRSFDDDAANEAPVLRLPRTNIEEKEDKYVFVMEMPGLAKKDVEVSVENDLLTVKGGTTVEGKENGGWLRREIRSSKFERSFSLGNDVDQENIKAKMADGILTVTLPKKSDKVGRKVDVN